MCSMCLAIYRLTAQVPGLTMPHAARICVDVRKVAGLIGALQQHTVCTTYYVYMTANCIETVVLLHRSSVLQVETFIIMAKNIISSK